MTTKKKHGERWPGDDALAKGLTTTRELLKVAQARVVELTTQLAEYRKYFDQDAYVRQLQGELQTLEQKHEDLVIRGTEREKELEYEVRKLQSQHDTLIAALSVVGRVATRSEGL